MDFPSSFTENRHSISYTKRRIMAIAPIWKDYFVTLGTEEVIPFRIRVQDQSGKIIYNGKSHIKPGKPTTPSGSMTFVLTI